MGGWCFLEEPQREANLVTALDEYLRFGLQAGVFFAPAATEGTTMKGDSRKTRSIGAITTARCGCNRAVS